jgi:hypothetical protein
MLRSATDYIKEENGRVPITHIDYACIYSYNEVVSHIKGSSMDTNGQKFFNIRRNKKSKIEWLMFMYPGSVQGSTANIHKEPYKLA